MEWSAIVTIILGSSFLGAMLNNVVRWWLKRTEMTNQATYLALNVAHLLEQYAYDCLSVVADHNNADSSCGNLGAYIVRVPKFPQLPDEDYRVFDLKLLDKIFDFQKQVCFANESLLFAFDVQDGDEASTEGCKSCLKLAHESLEIADTVRQHYKLKKRPLEFRGYSVRTSLREKLKQLTVRTCSTPTKLEEQRIHAPQRDSRV